tara:strand:- start:15111 stop:15653 length:543 start_codon:yes stop_codon:yes gene_type:complete
MSEKQRLIDIFDQSRVADEIRQLSENPTVIEGANAFYSHQALLTNDVSTGQAMCEWHVAGKADVLMMSEKHARALLALSDVPLVENRFQYPTKDFARARTGEIALGMTKENTDMVVMMQKDLVLGLIDPAMRQENQMRALMERMQDFMTERGLSASDMEGVMDQLEQDYPKNDHDGLDHD